MEKSNYIANDRFRRTVSGRREPLIQGCGVNIHESVVKLPDNHPCKGCVWYLRDTNVLFCPLPKCIRKK